MSKLKWEQSEGQGRMFFFLKDRFFNVIDHMYIELSLYEQIIHEKLFYSKLLF